MDDLAHRGRWFVLQAEDARLGCPIAETRFKVDDVEVLRSIIGGAADQDPELRHRYELNENDLGRIDRAFGARFSGELRPVTLVSWHAWRDRPYLIHDGFELPLMLDGRKPFAKFSDIDTSDWLDHMVAAFAPFVASGRIVERTVSCPLEKTSEHCVESRMIRTLYYALPGHEWRVDAYLLLAEVGYRHGWNDTYERMEGVLLGYEDWQNDWHIEARRRSGQKWHSERERAE